ncbi:hypothetical protein KOW79_022726 [Hemibagrus wyckioides]|uniref:Uncharacterized protein n=1 Tax=Hemibagrus wyckioides TaxID=337641 RepID=A0A9D3N2F4_9TELE|nr:hypothetical protein KOW79_022726 [Hemibagrus wyckioides]
MKTALWLLCLFGLALAVQSGNHHDREERSLDSNSEEGWPFGPLLRQMNEEQIRQFLQFILSALGPTQAPASTSPTSSPPLPSQR